MLCVSPRIVGRHGGNQASETRAYSDEAYRNAGVQVVENVDDCDILFGIKEADIRTL